MLALIRFAVPGNDAAFLEDARPALLALTAQAGCRAGWLARCVDEPGRWVLGTEWESVGAYRRALSSYDVKLNAVPVMYRALDEPSGYEQLLTWRPGAGLEMHASDLAHGSADSARELPDTPLGSSPV
jgi:quinol monooxygenase YgiN